MRVYSVIAEEFNDEDNGKYVSYGLMINDDSGAMSKISDLTLNKTALENFCGLLNSGDVSLNDLNDMIDDFLADTLYYL